MRGLRSEWSGSDAGLCRWTLRFPNDGKEMGFIQTRSMKLRLYLLYAAGAVGVLIILASLVSVANGSFLPTSSLYREGTSAGFYQFKVRIIGCVILEISVLFTMLAAYSSSVYRLIGSTGIEYLASCVIIAFMCTLVSLDYHYLSKLVGVDPNTVYAESHNFTDSGVLLIITGLVCGSHAMLPIRWHVLIPVDMIAVLLYGAFALVLGSPENNPIFTFIMLTANVCSSAVGKRSLECGERLAFSHLLSEKSLRCRAEFEISHIDQTRGPRRSYDSAGSAVESLPTTTATGVLFEVPPRPDLEVEGVLDKLVDIGEREHWLVRSTELVVDSKRVLGHGGFGFVYAGELHGTPVAVKVPYSTDLITRLPEACNELRILRQVRHPGIVLFHGAVVDPQKGHLSLVLEMVLGRKLDEFLQYRLRGRGHSFSIGSQYNLILSLCRAVFYLHAHRPCIVHGDLSSSNIVIQHFGAIAQPKLLDFGLSRMLTRHARPLGGTRPWVAPELRYSPRPQPSTHADVFSFGLLAYSITTSIKPEQGSEHAWLNLYWPRLSRLEPPCMRMVVRCVHDLAEHRPAISEIHEEILQWPEGAGYIQDEVGEQVAQNTLSASMPLSTNLPQSPRLSLQLRMLESPSESIVEAEAGTPIAEKREKQLAFP